MATILEDQIVEKKSEFVPLTEEFKFFCVIKERLEFQKLQAMKDIADAKYKIKSFSRQIKEVEKNIEKLQGGRKIKLKLPKPLEEKKQELKPLTVAQESMIRSYIPEPYEQPSVNKLTDTAKNTASLFVKSNVLQNRSEEIPDIEVSSRRIWKCKVCNDDFMYPNKKKLKEHLRQNHSY